MSAVPVLPDEGGTVISGMDTEDKSVREGTVTYDIRFRAIVPDSEEQIASSSTWRPRTIFTPAIR